MLWELTQRVVTLFSWLFSFVRWLHSYKKTYQLNCHVFCSRFMQFLESVGLLAIFSSFPRRASHLSMKHNLNVECEIPPMVRLYSDEKHDILNQKINPKNWRRKKVFGQNISFMQSSGTSEDGIVKVRCQKKTTILFGNFSQTSDPPPTPPFWEPLIQKKILVFILHFRT